jgi:hypothetical protein
MRDLLIDLSRRFSGVEVYVSWTSLFMRMTSAYSGLRIDVEKSVMMPNMDINLFFATSHCVGVSNELGRG